MLVDGEERCSKTGGAGKRLFGDRRLAVFSRFAGVQERLYYFGGKFFNNFSIALLRFFSFFSWFLLGSIVFVSRPCQTSC